MTGKPQSKQPSAPPPSEDRDEITTELPPVFIVGSGRCGSTVLDRSIGSHSLYTSFPFEPQLFSRAELSIGIHHVITGRIDKAALRLHLKERYRFERNNTLFGFYQWHDLVTYERIYKRFLRNLEKPSEACRELVDRIYSPYLKKMNSVAWVDGSPVNGCIMQQILAVYPNAKFIHSIRDGRAVARSYIRKGWMHRNFDFALNHWNNWVRETRKLGAQIGPDHYVELRFPEITEAPNETMVKIADFLGITPEPAMWSHISQDRANYHKTDYSSEETKKLMQIAPDLATEFGWV